MKVMPALLGRFIQLHDKLDSVIFHIIFRRRCLIFSFLSSLLSGTKEPYRNSTESPVALRNTNPRTDHLQGVVMIRKHQAPSYQERKTSYHLMPKLERRLSQSVAIRGEGRGSIKSQPRRRRDVIICGSPLH